MTTPRDNTNRGKQEGQSLDKLCGTPMETGRFISLAVGITAALAEIHGQNITHKNISPRSILIDSETGEVSIADSSNPSFLRFEYPSIKTVLSMGKTLAYISPEQTGRMNRLVDYRTDLYSLGITFYEMLTGTLPFKAADALEWVHCHIARVPLPPAELNPGIPSPLSAIVMTLLAKTAEDRYQTAAGLKFDLDICRAQWESGKSIAPFILGKGDISDRLLIPQKLYGREHDIAALNDAFSRVLLSGTPEFVMVAGYSGIGKTSLVRELYKPVLREQGYFISGKFDQYKRNIPYTTLAEAFRELIQQILTESDEKISDWRHRLQSVLGNNGQLIVDIIPHLELILGKQPPVPKLSQAEMQNRFITVFQHFLSVFTRKEHPLVLFLDDLQWVDPASLKLIESIITDSGTKYLLLIGAYRNNEVAPSHPLMLMMDTLRMISPAFQSLTLSPLKYDDLGHLLVDTLHSDETALEQLSRLIFEKTAGNPFFVIQFLITLQSEGLVRFDRNKGAWEWEIDRIYAQGYTDNVVDLMVAKLVKFPEEIQQILRLAACIGNRFEIRTLEVICGRSYEEIRSLLRQPLHDGLLLLSGTTYRFLHDRVQQAAYSLIPAEQRAAVHLQIGRIMLEHAPSELLEENVFDIVSHFNLSISLVSNKDEKQRVAELNLMAGRKAKASTAYLSALNYLTSAQQLLEETDWETNYDLSFEIYRELAEVEYLNNNYADAKELIDLLVSKARTDLEKAGLYNILIIQYTLTALYGDAISTGREALRLLEFTVPDADLDKELTAELLRYKVILGTRKISSLAGDPEMSDPVKRISLELLSNMVVPARYTDSTLFALVSVLNVNLSLEQGPTAKSTVGYTAFGMVLNSVMNNFRDAYEFGIVALRLSERFNALTQKCQACFMLGHYLNHWVKHLKWADGFLNDGYQAGISGGEMQWTGYTLAYKLFQPFYRGVQINQVRNEIPNLLFFTQKTRNQWATDTLSGLQTALSVLLGESGTAVSAGSDVDGSEIFANEDGYLSGCLERRSFGALGRYAVLKAQVQFLYGRTDDALAAVGMAREYAGFFSSSITVAELNFYHSLILATLHDSPGAGKNDNCIESIEMNQKQMKTWADSCPENFLHLYLLVEAELARITHKDLKSERLYEQSIQSARDNGFVQDEGIACELAARFYLRRSFETIAAAFLREARACYERWGAIGKVMQLDRKYPRLMDEEHAAYHAGIDEQVGHVDAVSLVRASQAISGEIVFENLLETLMRILLENAGADKGCLLLAHDNDVSIDTEVRLDDREIKVLQPGPADIASVLPVTLVNYVRRTREKVILDDAPSDNMFSADPYITEHKPMSVLCLPLLRQTSLTGLLYLENGLVKGVFTAERIAVLEILAAQAAISLENAALYRERTHAVNALRQSEETYRKIFDDCGNALMFIEDDMTISMCNKEFEKLSGYEKHEVEGKKKWTEFVARPEDLQRMQAYHRLRRINPEDVPTAYEFQWVDRNGVRRDAGITVSTMPGSKQSLAVLTDITERKQAEEALRQSERKFRAIFDKAFQFMGLLTTDGTVLEANQPALNFKGIKESDVIGRPFWETAWWAHSEEQKGKLREAIGTAAKGEFVRFEATHLAADGTLHYVDFSIKPITDDNGKVVLLIPEGRDITERKWAEEEHARLVTAIEQAGEAIYIADTDWIIHYANPAFERITGYSRNEIIGRHTSILKSGRHDKSFYKKIRDTIAAYGVWSGRLTNKKKDGTLYDAEVTVSSVYDKSGAVINYVSIHRDITGEVRLERVLRQTHKMEAIGTLAGGIAHDFNNILTAIVSQTELALYKTSEGSPLRNNLEQIRKGSARATDLVKQIISFSRQADLEKKPVQIASIIEEALRLLRSSLPTTIKIRREIEIGPSDDVVMADPTQIHQILMNLGTNAAYAMRDKGGILHVAVKDVEADSSMVSRNPELRPGKYVKLTVSDTGNGMDAAIMERMFDPYFTTKKPGEGTGMGLAVVQGIVKNHGGAITVYSEPGQGTVFSVYLPKLEVDLPHEEAEPEPPPMGNERILFVDDEEVLVASGAEILELLGYDVTAVSSSPEALNIFRSSPDAFDIVITDMTMPGMTGKELTREILSIRPDMPIILCTGFSEYINGQEAKECGIGGYLTKPYEVCTLAKTIRLVLKESKEGKEN
jgi:PAS domain S-box-containing protein